MSRRDFLTLIELTLVTVALAASLGLLAHAANAGSTQWAAATFTGVITALSLLLPTILALLLRAAWLGAPGVLWAVRAWVRDWREWRGIQRAAAPPRRPARRARPAQPARPAQDTMAVRPRHAAGGVR